MAKNDSIVLYHSETATNVPSAGDLSRGELAVNLSDRKLFVKDHTDSVVELVNGLSGFGAGTWAEFGAWLGIYSSGEYTVIDPTEQTREGDYDIKPDGVYKNASKSTTTSTIVPVDLTGVSDGTDTEHALPATASAGDTYIVIDLKGLSLTTRRIIPTGRIDGEDVIFAAPVHAIQGPYSSMEFIYVGTLSGDDFGWRIRT